MYPKISVVMAAFNEELNIHNAILSIQNQTFKDWELVITDDGSSDNTLSIIRKLANHDERILLLHNHSNLGLARSLNKGIEASKGQYIARMDADDISMASRLKEELSVFKVNYNIGVVFSLSQIIDSDNDLVCNKWQPKKINNILDKMPYHNYITHSSCMINHDLFKKFFRDCFVNGIKFILIKRCFFTGNLSLMNEKISEFGICN